MRNTPYELSLTHSCNSKPASSPSPTMSSITETMQLATHFPLKNKKLMLQVIVSSFFPLLLIILLHDFVASPFIAKVEDGYENSSLKLQDLISLVATEIPFAFAFSLALLFASTITISAADSTRQEISLGLKEMLISLISIWKRILVSGLCCSFLMIVFVGMAINLIRFSALMGVLAAFTCPYLASFCFIMPVISTIEDNYQVKEAFRQAREIIKWRRFQGYRLTLVLILMSLPVYVMLYVTSTDDDDENGLITQIAFLLGSTILFCLTHFYNNVVFTLFYQDFKQVNGEHVEEQVSTYSSVPTLPN